jgi:hypothetical protein
MLHHSPHFHDKCSVHIYFVLGEIFPMLDDVEAFEIQRDDQMYDRKEKCIGIAIRILIGLRKSRNPSLSCLQTRQWITSPKLLEEIDGCPAIHRL